MPRFFTDVPCGDYAELSGEDARHVSFSLRMRTGEQLVLCDGRGTDFLCRIESFEEGRVRLRILKSCPSSAEPKTEITLFLALSKGDKLDLVIQKAVELGACAIVPFLSARCVSRPTPDAFEKKRARYRRIAYEAAKQCGRGRIPEVHPLQSFLQLRGQIADFDRPLFFYERAEQPLRSIPLENAHTIALIVGSEGGFDPEEAAALKRAGALEVSLGPRILRCETAPIAALAAVLYAVGEM
ncbi:MAG: 16S rRNA (uracil(1498)-N(3))-methyltransferase [Provencibacterium sp.]|jgi:16S rRNA (uracil1498-N3)-methyltransferase|nr:16S rRNA (uracil(1498)-N(3))-methyltransferase [Provencibacterium sp.]